MLIGLLLGAGLVAAETNEHLFHSFTGMRMDRYRAPTPLQVRGARVVSAADLKARLQKETVTLIDVMPDANARYLADERKWLLTRPRNSLPGAVWLVNVGFGDLSADMERYFRNHMRRLTKGN